MTAFDSGGLRKLPPNRVHAVLHKPFDVDRVVDLVRDSAALWREERMPRTIATTFAADEDEESPVS